MPSVVGWGERGTLAGETFGQPYGEECAATLRMFLRAHVRGHVGGELSCVVRRQSDSAEHAFDMHKRLVGQLFVSGPGGP